MGVQLFAQEDGVSEAGGTWHCMYMLDEVLELEFH